MANISGPQHPPFNKTKINNGRYSVKEKLGQGSFGQVFKGISLTIIV